jgi:hypothetical protein
VHTGAVVAVDNLRVSTVCPRVRTAKFMERKDGLSFACNLEQQPRTQRYRANDVVVMHNLAAPF